MNFGKGGQNIVQSGNNNPNVFRGAGGSILGKFLDIKLRRQDRDYHRGKDLEARKEFEDYKNESGLKSRAVETAIQGPLASLYYDHAFEKYGEDHPEVIAKNKQANDYIRPEFAEAVRDRGLTSGKHGVFPAQIPASIPQNEAIDRRRREREAARQAALDDKQSNNNGNKVNTSSAIATSPVGGFNPEENDIQSALHQNNKPNSFPFESTAGSSGNFSPNKFNDDNTPVYSEINAEEDRANAAKNPFDTKEGYKERTAHLTDGINDGKGGNY